MKKSLLFALALVAGVLAFTSCDGNNPETNPLVGTWSYTNQPLADGGYSIMSVVFTGDWKFELREQWFINGKLDESYSFMEGTYSIKGDVASLHYTGHGHDHNGERQYAYSFEPFDEKIQFSVNGNTLTLVRYYGEEHTTTETYTKQ